MAFLVLMGSCWGTALAQPSWKRIGDITEARFFFDSYPISPSEVLIIGGHPRGMAGLDASATCDILDVDKRTIVRGPRMNVPHAAYSSVQMPDGSIVVIGGMTGPNLVATDVIERFDPVSRRWDIVGYTRERRMHTAATALDAYRILIVGGRLGSSLSVVRLCEIFDIRTGVRTPMPDLPVSMADGSVTRTKTGQILAFGGRDGGAGSNRYAAVYRLDTVAMQWNVAGNFPTPIVTNRPLIMANGDLMVVGGSYWEYNESTTADLMSNGVYEWNGNAFDSIGRMQYGRVLHRAIQYDDSTLLVVGGKIPPKTSTPTCEWIDIRTGRATPGPDMSLDRAHVSLVGMERNGKKRVFAIGGMTGSSDVATTIVEELSMSCNPDIGTTFGDGDVRTAGSARSNHESVVLTEPESYSAGSVWARSRINVRDGFTVSFRFRITGGNDNDQQDGSRPGADGIAFVVQNSGPSMLGKVGEGVGYDGIPKALAVEFDTYSNPAYSDPNGNHIAVQSGGLGPCRPIHASPYHLGSTTDIVSMIPDGRIFYGKVEYQGNRLSVYLDTTDQFPLPALVVDNVDLGTLIGLDASGTAWIGFTSATGKSVERHELLSWTVGICGEVAASVEGEGPASEEIMNRSYIAPMPSRDAARLFSTAMSGGKVTIVLYDVTGAVLGTMMTDADELTNGVDLPFHPSMGTYYVHVADGMRSITLPWVVMR